MPTPVACGVMGTPMVPLVTASSWWEARIIAAQLGAAGFLWDLRGVANPLDARTPVTVLVRGDEAAAAGGYLAAAAGPDDG
jgi:hypothetical protein